jgi:hypothetical protein
MVNPPARNVKRSLWNREFCLTQHEEGNVEVENWFRDKIRDGQALMPPVQARRMAVRRVKRLANTLKAADAICWLSEPIFLLR